MTRKAQLAILVGILTLAAVLRLSFLDWDDYNHYHPDERYITWVATSIEWPESWQTAFSPQQSTINPFYWPAGASSPGLVLEQDKARRFAYGHLPLYMGVAFTRLLEASGPSLGRLFPEKWSLTQDLLNQGQKIEFRHITAAGRALTAILDIASVGLLFLIGRWLYSPAVGLLAAALLTTTVLHIQLARFFTVDPFLTFFILLAVVFMVLALRQNKLGIQTLSLLLASLTVGLAVGSKFSAVLLVLPLAVTVFLLPGWRLERKIGILVAALLLAFLAFFITNPFAILDSSCPASTGSELGPLTMPAPIARSCYLQNVVSQGLMVRGGRDVPFVRQYAGTIPFLYYMEMLFKWGMGPLLAIAGFAGLAWAFWRGIKVGYKGWLNVSGQRSKIVHIKILSGQGRFPFNNAEIVVLCWVLPFFLTTGILQVKFTRYMQPVLPFFVLYGAAMLLSIRLVALRRLVIALVLVVTALYAFSFTNLYRQVHPWIAASQWIFQNVDEGSVIVSEMWDDRLPDNAFVGDELMKREIFELKDVNWLSGTEQFDNKEKIEENLNLIENSNYLVIASNRNYGVIPRLPERYPLSSQYYQALFDGRLGFEVAYVGTRMPNLFGVAIKGDSFSWPVLNPPDEVSDYLDRAKGINMGRFDESFTVYDQPLVIILENTRHLSAGEMLTLFQTD